MSDFLTRIVQRQRGELPTVQPLTAPIFAPESNRELGPSAEPAWISALPAEREQEPEFAGKPSRRVLPREQAEPGAPALLVPEAAWAGEAQQPLVRRESEDTTDPPERKAPLNMIRPSSTHWPIPERTVTAQRQAAESDPVSAEVMQPNPGVKTGHLTHTVRVELPPRLVGQKTKPHADPGSAPLSLAAAAVSEKQSEPIVPDAAEPPVQVTIGRIEVTAVSAPPAPKRKTAMRQPSMSLRDYLAQRRAGTR